MSALQKLRHAPWLSAALVLLLVAGIVAPLFLHLGSRYWAYGAGLALVILAFGRLERMLKALARPRPSRTRGKLRGVRGGRGRGKDFDLADDETTDGQRWLM